MPEHTVALLRGLVKVRVKHFPAVFLLANTLAGLLLPRGTRAAALLAWAGFLAGWTHLRFYKRQPDLGATGTGDGSSGATLRGDASETFAFAAFWPDVVQPPIAAASDAIFNAFVALRLCTPFSADEVESGNRQASARGDELPSLMSPGGGQWEKRGRREARGGGTEARVGVASVGSATAAGACESAGAGHSRAPRPHRQTWDGSRRRRSRSR